MTKAKGYEISEEDIEKVIKYLKHTDPQNANREGAIRFLEGVQATSHMAAHSEEGLKALKDLLKELKRTQKKSN